MSQNARGGSQNSRGSGDSGYSSSISSTQSRSFSTQPVPSRTPLTPLAPSSNTQQPGLLGQGRGAQRGRGTGRGAGRGLPGGSLHFGGGDDAPGGGAGAIVCTCGEDAKMLTVRKEGPNTGQASARCCSLYDCSLPVSSF